MISSASAAAITGPKDSEISGLENLNAYLKHGNCVTRFSFPVLEVPAFEAEVYRTPGGRLHRARTAQGAKGPSGSCKE
jgi:hypothetical protein